MREGEAVVRLHDVVCLRATDKALLCLVQGEEVWFPKSHVHDDSEVYDDSDNSEGTLIVSEWIAIQKKLA